MLKRPSMIKLEKLETWMLKAIRLKSTRLRVQDARCKGQEA